MISESSQIVKESKTYEFGEFRLEAENFLLLRNNQTVQLPMKAVQILLALVEADGRVLKKEEILERVWADTFVEESNLTHHISALRRALGEEKNSNKFIETIARRGYRFVAPFEETTNSAAEITISEKTLTRIAEEEEVEIGEPQLPVENVGAEESTSLEISVSPEDVAKKTQRSWRSAALAGAIAVVAFAAIGFALYKFINPAPIQFEAKNITRVTSSGRVKLAVISPDGKFIIYSQEEHDGQQSLWMRHVGSESNVQTVAPSKIEYRGLNISPNGNSLYYVDEKGTLFQMPVLGGATKKIVEGLTVGHSFISIGISPDGKQVAFARRFDNGESALFIVNTDGTNERMLAKFYQPKLNFQMAWSPDGKVIACSVSVGGSQNIVAVQVADGTFSLILPKNWSSTTSRIMWLPDSKSLLLFGGNKVRRIWQISYPGGEARQVNSDINVYNSISLTSDGRFLAAVRSEQAAYLWTTPPDDVGRARQLTAGFEKYDGVGLGWLPDGKIIYSSLSSGKSSVWAVEPTGGDHKQIIKEGGFNAISSDGRFVVYQNQTGWTATNNVGLYRTDLSDGSEKQLTEGVDTYPTFSPDGKWIVFTRWGERVALWKVPFEGGEPTQLLVRGLINPVVSPNGKIIAVVLSTLGRPQRIALLPFDGGEITRTFDVKLELNPTSNRRPLQWTADGRGIYFIAITNGVSNIWQQPIDGSPPVQVTNFKDGRIFNFAFSPDGSQLALSRGTFNSDVVLIENQK